ncbi:MAG: hypothetical protein U0L24_02400 [Lachnospiraceae bacterium]|nr:hypothetical protein [Lachnospiraceae bacterium]
MSKKKMSAIAEFKAEAEEYGKTYAELQVEETLRQQALEIEQERRRRKQAKAVAVAKQKKG